MLTVRLREEWVEVGRSRQFDAMRSRNVASSSAPQTPSPDREQLNRQSEIHTLTPSPIGDSSPRVGLRKRTRENPWGIPGGIVSRFGRDALAQRQAEEPQLEQQPEPEEIAPEPATETQAQTPTAETDQPTEDASERETEQDEAARITTELQSH